MKYTAQSTKYIFKNFLYIFPFAIIPAFFLSLSMDQEAIYCIFETIYQGKIHEFHFSHLFRAVSVLNFASWQAIVFGFLGIILMVVCVAMMMAQLEKHMRIGKRTYNGLFSRLNDNLLPTCGYTLLVLVIYELWSFLVAAFLFFFSKIPETFTAYTLMIVFFLGMHVLLIYAIGLIYLWLPCMQITGFKPMEALYYSNHLMSKVKWKILLGQLTALVVTETIICLCAVFLQDTITSAIVTTVFFALLIMLYCVRMMIAYFDRDNIERADLKRYYNG